MRARSDALPSAGFRVRDVHAAEEHDVPLPDGRWVEDFDTENDLLHDAWKWRIAAKYRASHTTPGWPPSLTRLGRCRLPTRGGHWNCRRKTIRLD